MASGGLSAARLARIGRLLDGAVGRGELAGAVALVARRGAVHVATAGVQDLETGAPMRRDTIFRIASMTKPVLAAAAMTLVEEAVLRLDDPVDPWLPELAGRRVLRAPDAAVDDTVPARRPITLRDLLTLRPGIGAIMAPPGTYPVQQAIEEAGLAPGPDPIPFGPDEYMRRLGGLPLLHQPGERWLYHTGYDILAVLIGRAAGAPLGTVLAERLLGPLGMADTGFFVPEAAIGRLTTCYAQGDGNDRLAVYDPARDGLWSRPPALESELVSTADDYLAFARLLLDGGRHGRRRLLARPSVRLMTTDQIPAEQKAASPFFPGFWDSSGWGFGGAVVTASDGLASPGSYGWSGGFGTTFLVDGAEDLAAILLTQRLMRGPDDDAVGRDVLTLATAAIDD